MSTAALKKEEGVALFKRGKIVEALAAFEEAIKALKPEEKSLKAALLNNRAHCNAQLRLDPKLIIKDCTAVLEIEPNNIKALLRRASAYEQIEKIRGALHTMEGADDDRPLSTRVLTGA